jgi:hypothetical protein
LFFNPAGMGAHMAKAHTLIDNFNDNLTDSSRWKVDGDAREVNQRLEARPPPHTNDGYAGYYSNASYDHHFQGRADDTT